MKKKLIDKYLLKEDIDISQNKVPKAIAFSDIIKSSNKWIESPEEMIQAIEELTSLIDDELNKYEGITVKSIGDAFMFAFEDLVSAIHFSIEIQESLEKNPITVSDENIQLRIGICMGEVFEASSTIQNFNLKDYLGNTVNTASRIESKVCEDGDVAFAYIDEELIDKSELSEIINEYSVDATSYVEDEDDEIKRSGRILNNIQRHTYEDVDELKGVDEIDVYKINI